MLYLEVLKTLCGLATILPTSLMSRASPSLASSYISEILLHGLVLAEAKTYSWVAAESPQDSKKLDSSYLIQRRARKTTKRPNQPSVRKKDKLVN
jgi:hypothetical protein